MGGRNPRQGREFGRSASYMPRGVSSALHGADGASQFEERARALLPLPRDAGPTPAGAHVDHGARAHGRQALDQPPERPAIARPLLGAKQEHAPQQKAELGNEGMHHQLLVKSSGPAAGRHRPRGP